MAMVRRGKRAARRGGKKRAMKPRVQRRRLNAGVPERASMTEVQATPGQLATNTSYSVYNVSLASLTRARDVAKGYQFYRIKRITLVIKPTQDTFVSGGNSVPYLYYMIDRVKQFAAGFTVDQLKAMGAKARRVDDKIITFSFTPSVLTETFDNTLNANTAVQYKLAPWLPCKDTSQVGVWNPNSTDHLGIVWRLEQVLGAATAYNLERHIEVEFKKPAIPTAALTQEDVPLDFDDLLNPPVSL